LNEGLGLPLRGPPSCTGVRRIVQAVDAAALPQGDLAAVAIDGKKLRI